MNLSTLNDAELVELIRKASAELAVRMSKPDVERIPAPRETIIMREPPASDKEFCLRIKTMLEKNLYISASERHQVAELAGTYGEWIKRQGLPTEKGTKVWRIAQQNASRYKPAREQ